MAKKLTQEQVDWIREEGKRIGRGAGAAIARRLGMNGDTIRRILRGDMWSEGGREKKLPIERMGEEEMEEKTGVEIIRFKKDWEEVDDGIS